MCLLILSKYGNRHGKQNRCGCCFHPACCRSRRSSNHHQKHHSHLSGICHFIEISSIKSSCSCCHRLEKRAPDPFSQRHMLKFQKKEHDRRNQDQKGTDSKNYFALQPVFFNMPFILLDIQPGKKSNTANHDQCHNHKIHNRVCRKRSQG